MQVDRASAIRAFRQVRTAQLAIDQAVAHGASDVEVSRLLSRKFDPAVRDAQDAGIFVGYFQRWAENLLNPTPRKYPLVAQPTDLGWKVYAQEEGADVTCAQRALD